MDWGLKGKTILVTGASGGVGLAVARELKAEGCRLALHYRRGREKILEALGEDENVRLYAADLTRGEEVRRLAERAVGDLGPVYGLVNNAGDAVGAAPADSIEEGAWDATFALNARAPYLLFKALAPHFEPGGARVVNVSSIAARYGGSPVTLHYACAKAAVETLTAGLARWGAPRGILVNCVRPGMIDTEFHERLGRTREQIEERAKQIPLGRIGRPEDVAAAIVFLLSAQASYITGQVYPVSGGD